eukprot:CAMPEP_0183377792 /NCGR_PEP_ID=MMETSP0164_2-20130417/123988_1 /TAXON_ID=221442 /ORGANISM="Coccolithus pelagicus ssp braarudi, Strain PLY182g" /LENGTH=69 /DNA_ID=CAMNT_0025555291 /DNA_START=85 /DNA_END=294 /DNA_ORIENTATION=+
MTTCAGRQREVGLALGPRGVQPEPSCSSDLPPSEADRTASASSVVNAAWEAYEAEFRKWECPRVESLDR